MFLNQQTGSIVADDEGSKEVAKIHSVAGPADLKHLEQGLLAVGQQGQQGTTPESLGGEGGITVMDASDWKVIPAGVCAVYWSVHTGCVFVLVCVFR